MDPPVFSSSHSEISENEATESETDSELKPVTPEAASTPKSEITKKPRCSFLGGVAPEDGLMPPKKVIAWRFFIAGIVLYVLFILSVNVNFVDHSTIVVMTNKYPVLKFVSKLFHTVPPERGVDNSPQLRENWDWNQIGTPQGSRFFSDEEIVFCEGTNQVPYLVILGNVFDVSSNYGSYKAGTGYHGFIGQDGTRAFVSGDFTKEGLISNLDDLKPDDYLGLIKWLGFYYKTYPHVGYHIGRFYNKYGKETDYMKKVRKWVKDAEKIAAADQDLHRQFPACNMQWDGKTEVTQYWCSQKSGGIDRDWEGYPHMFQEEEGKPYRCACIHTNHLKDPRVKPYENCPPRSERCEMHVPAQKSSSRPSDEL